MSFLYPTYLWALLGLLVPLAIHLWSKKEGKTIKVGSTKLLSESDSKQSRSIQLNELLLLILRMVLTAMLVFLIAGFQIKKRANSTPITYIIEPTLVQDQRIQTIVDTLESGASLRLLQTGFPELDKDEFDFKNDETPNYWQLAKDMETLRSDSIVVFTSAKITGLKGARPTISKNSTWIALDSNEPVERVLSVTKTKDTVEILSITSDQNVASFSKKRVAKNSNTLGYTITNDSLLFSAKGKEQTVALTAERTAKVMLVYTDSLKTQKKYIEASLNAISKYLKRTIDIEIRTATEDIAYLEYDLVVWLSTAIAPNTTTKLLVYRPDTFANTIIEAGTSSTIFYLTEPLNRENSIDKHLSEQLLQLFDFYKEEKLDIGNYDMRSIDISELEPITSVSAGDKKQYELLDISKWLWLLVAIGLIAERSIAKYRKQ
ncbi:BatA domain-containing protein [Aquimarina latercula]|uniref:BatA domain-containing protein n=1 Tax=Aquimarina latercula TaxID=987 RepID=UPI0003F974BF|nr:BatA domain-containing protein [Aquimarina latercula]